MAKAQEQDHSAAIRNAIVALSSDCMSMAIRSPCARWLAPFPQAQILEQAMAVLCGRYSLAKRRFTLTLTLYLKKFNLHTNLDLTLFIQRDHLLCQYHGRGGKPLGFLEQIMRRLFCFLSCPGRERSNGDRGRVVICLIRILNSSNPKNRIPKRGKSSPKKKS